MTNENVSIPEELARAIEELTSTFGRIKEKVKEVIEIAKKHEFPNFLLRDLIAKSLAKRELSTRSITYYLPAELKNEKRSFAARLEKTRTKNQVEQTSSMNTEGEITDIAIGDITENNSVIESQKYDYEGQKEENKIRFELKQDIEKLREKVESQQATIELLNTQIEASKNQKLEARIIDIEELNKQLKIENEQLRHALTKKSFETAKEMEEKTSSDEIKNLTNYIKQLEETNTKRYNEIQELNKKIQSFSNLDRVVEPQPLELDLTDKGGFLGQFFSYRGRKVWMLHDGQKIINVKLGGDIKK
jgi:DNA repair exonuclease SbcCD ATPase subunit